MQPYCRVWISSFLFDVERKADRLRLGTWTYSFTLPQQTGLVKTFFIETCAKEESQTVYSREPLSRGITNEVLENVSSTANQRLAATLKKPVHSFATLQNSGILCCYHDDSAGREILLCVLQSYTDLSCTHQSAHLVNCIAFTANVIVLTIQKAGSWHSELRIANTNTILKQKTCMPLVQRFVLAGYKTHQY